MADTTLHFKLGSTFDGSGFSAASKEIENAAKQGKKLSGAMGNVLSEAQKLDGALGKTAAAASNVVSGFAQMGIIGGILAGAKTAMDLFFESAKSDLDKMAKDGQDAADKARRELQKTVDAHIKGVHDANEATRTMGAEAVKQFDEVAAAAVRVSQLIAQTDIARGQHSIAAVQVEKLNAIIKEETEAGKALVAAKYDLRIAEMKAAQASERATSSTEEARKALLTAQDRVAETNNHVALAQEGLARAQKAEANARVSHQGDWQKLAAEVKAAETAYKAAVENQRKSAQGVAEAEEKLKAETIKAATVREEGQAAILQARIALDKVNEAERKAAEAREKEAEAARKAAQLTAEKSAFDDNVRTHANDQIALLTKEIDELTGELKKIDKSLDDVKDGMATDARVKNGTFGTYGYSLGPDGTPDNFIDWERAMRFAERAERDRRTKERRDSAHQKRMEDLQKKFDERGEKALSDREKAQLKAWQEYQDAKNGRERREQEIKAKQMQIDTIRKKMADDLSKSRELLEQALEIQ